MIVWDWQLEPPEDPELCPECAERHCWCTLDALGVCRHCRDEARADGE